MSFALVAQASKAGGKDTGTTDAVNTTGADLIVLAVSWYSGTSGGFTGTPTLADSKGNTWTALATRVGGSGSLAYSNRLYYCVNPTVGSGHTFTASGVNGYWEIGYVAVSGAHASPFHSESGTGATSGTSVQPGSLTPPQGGCLLVTGLDFSGGSGASVGSGYTASTTNNSVGNAVGGGIAYLIQPTAAAINPTWSWTTSGYNASAMAVFVPAGGAPDTTAPVLTSPIGTQTGSTTATIGATTDEGNGTLYGVATTSATTPSAAQVKAGQNSAGAAATFAGSVAVGSTGAKTISATGLTASTAYYAHLMHEDAAGNQSNVVTSAQFTTAAGPVTVAVTDANLFYVPEGWYRSGSTYIQTVNPGNYLKIKFTGTSVKLNVSVATLTAASVASGDYPAIAYQIDDGVITRTQLTSSSSQVTLATGLASGTHSLWVQLVGLDWDSYDRWNTPALCLRITGLEIDAGATTAAPDLLSGRALFYGDSHTEGWESLASGVSVANQDANLAYPNVVGRSLGCEFAVVGFAGQGWTVGSGGSSNVPDFEDAWDFYHSGASRLSGGLFPTTLDYVFICHGDNDSAGVQTAVTATLPAIRAAAPSASIFVLLPPNRDQASAIIAGEAAGGDADTHLIDHGFNLLVSPFVNGSHLSGLRGHPRFAAEALQRVVPLLSGDAAGVPLIGGGLVR